MYNLKMALLANASFSVISGLLLIFYSKAISHLFWVENESIFRYIGIALVFFSITIVFEIFRLRPFLIKWIIIQDILWVLGSMFLIVFKPFTISQSGYGIIIIIALIVLFMAINQYRSLIAHPSKN